MKQKTITVKTSAIIKREEGGFEELEFPKVNKLLDDGWIIKDVFQSTTNQNVGFLFLTFVFSK